MDNLIKKGERIFKEAFKRSVNKKGIDGIVSDVIPWSGAVRLIHEYNKHPNPLKVHTEDGYETLHGFIFERKHVLKALGIDESALPKTPESSENKNVPATKLFIAMGYHVNEFVINDGFTTILFGMDDNRKLLYKENAIVDYCDPCPDRCPTNVKLSTL